MNQVLHRRRHVGRKEGVKTKRERPDRESLLWMAGLRAVGTAPDGADWVHFADRGADNFEFVANCLAAGQGFVVRSHTTFRVSSHVATAEEHRFATGPSRPRQ